jgi:hypothetical protein
VLRAFFFSFHDFYTTLTNSGLTVTDIVGIEMNISISAVVSFVSTILLTRKLPQLTELTSKLTDLKAGLQLNDPEAERLSKSLVVKAIIMLING